MPSKRIASAMRHRTHAALLAALGDETRLLLLTRLSNGRSSSIAQLTVGSSLTRQAISKHLRVMQASKLVRCSRSGRESLFELDPRPLIELSKYLDLVSRQWNQALLRLKSIVEEQ